MLVKIFFIWTVEEEYHCRIVPQYLILTTQLTTGIVKLDNNTVAIGQHLLLSVYTLEV